MKTSQIQTWILPTIIYLSCFNFCLGKTLDYVLAPPNTFAWSIGYQNVIDDNGKKIKDTYGIWNTSGTI